jgi:hypothetical protein
MFGDEAIRLQNIPEYEPNMEDIARLVCKHFNQSIIEVLNRRDVPENQESRAMLAGLLFERLQLSVTEIETLMPRSKNSNPIEDFFRMKQSDTYFANLFVHLWLQAGTHPDFREC